MQNSQNEEVNEAELNSRTRDKLRRKLLNGDLDSREIEVNFKVPTHNVKVLGPQSGMEGLGGLQDMLSGMVPKKTQKRKMSVKDAREHFIQEESEKLIDQDSVNREALRKAGQSGIIFIDEIDKIAVGSSKKGGPDVSREGVQRDLLPIIEGCTVNTKYGNISTDHVLFIGAGAFHLSKPSDLIPELQGRLPIRVNLDNLGKEDFIRILKEPRNALTKQYIALLASENVSLEFTDDAISEMAGIAAKVNEEVENIGARRLHTILSNLLEEILFEIPDISSEKEFKIDGKMVLDKLSALQQDKDLSHYIL